MASEAHQDAASLRSVSTDFGRIVQQTPRVLVRASSGDDVAEGLARARASGLPVTIRGSAHSCNGQATSDGGVLISLADGGRPALRFLEGDRVEVSAASRWRQVEAELNRRHRRVAALADHLGLSVGGTLSVGGYGFDSIVHGAQVDQVERLRLITPDGRAIWCSATDNPDLFAFSLAALGQLGVLDRVVLRTRPYRKMSALFSYRHRSLIDLVTSFRWMADGERRPDLFKAVHSRGRFVSVYGVACDDLAQARAALPPPEVAGFDLARRLLIPHHRRWRSRGVALWTASFGRRRRLWSDFIFDLPGLEAFTAFLSRQLAAGAFEGCLKSLYFLGIRRPAGPDRFPLEAAAGKMAAVKFGIGLYCMLPAADSDLLGRLRGVHRRCLEECVDLGGRPYLYGWHEFGESTLERLYGDDFRRLLELKRGLDPDGLFQPNKLLSAAPTMPPAGV